MKKFKISNLKYKTKKDFIYIYIYGYNNPPKK